MSLPRAREPLACGRADCAFPEGGRCAREAEFPDPLGQCEDLEREWVREAPSSDEPPREITGPPVVPPATSSPFEWSGAPMTLEAVRKLPCPRTVALLGHHNAGKTTLIASFFLALASRASPDLGWRFAGSRTLPRLLDLAQAAAAWRGHRAGQILDHTPKGARSQFVHLALRTTRLEDPRIIDLVISDIAGEHVETFSSHESDLVAPTMSFVRGADAFLVLVDCVRLFRQTSRDGERVGPAYDGAVSSTLTMVRNQVANRVDPSRTPVAVVWAKFDTVAAEVRLPASAGSIDASDWGVLGRRARRTLASLQAIQSDGARVSVHAVSAFPAALDHSAAFNAVAPFRTVLADDESPAAFRRRRVIPNPLGHPFVAMTRAEDE